jgi:hypothetical protein
MNQNIIYKNRIGKAFSCRRIMLKKIVWGSIFLILSSCSSEKIQQYRVAKIQQKPISAQSESKRAEDFSYSAPQAWKKQPASEMRKLSFSIEGGGDFSVVTLPGAAGDLKGNLNRWRGQVGLPPLEDPAEIQKSITTTTFVDVPATELELYAAADKPDKAMRVVLFEKNGMTWFFKLAGPRQLVKAQKKPFMDFMHSIKIKTDPTIDAQTPALPNENSDMSTQALPPMKPQETQTKLTYSVPKAWQEKPQGSIRVASFSVKQGALSGDVSIVSLAGDGGGLLSNTNRWRKQLELVPTDQEGLKNAVKDIQIDGHKAYFMALFSGMEGQGMMTAMVEQGGQTWFVKMVGPSKLIQNQENDFLSFVKSIQFHDKGAQS